MLLEKGTTYVFMVNRLLQKPFTALAYTLVSFMQRLVWLASMLPLVCLCVLIGLTEGLVRRDLRRFGSGLESVFMHRYVIKSGSSVATTLWVFYLAQPLFLPATLVLLPAAFWFGVTIWMAAGSFKLLVIRCTILSLSFSALETHSIIIVSVYLSRYHCKVIMCNSSELLLTFVTRTHT
ncbi:DUF4400 domain-containing protein [Citrobacter portucalensis]|nr:DUF4400 domain-containing protein [Citrobacter portucalensis]MCX8985722.1 DUF4400 domain-containing protein [Citrobacter portucalensis]